MELNVYLFDKLAGILKTTADRGIVFSYNSDYLTSKNQPLSISLPLQEKEFSQKECVPYFIGLLPEGNVKQRIAQDLHISELSTVKLLEALGGECAGTVSFYSTENDNVKLHTNRWELNEKNYLPISEHDIFQMIQNIQERPLLYSKKELRLSLAGAQEKISLAYFNNSWHLPKNGAPSTHIIKPSRKGNLASIAANEFICMQLAKKMGMNVPETRLLNIEGEEIFVCKRYDRNLNDEKIIERVHQEDFCQALRILSDNKYQADGGPSYLDCYSLIKNHFSSLLKDSSTFFKSMMFNYLIGNCDCHAKNYSVIFSPEKTLSLSPFYDLVSTTVYDSLTKKMAMKLGSEYDIAKITKSDFIKQAEILGIKPRFWIDTLEEYSVNFENAFQEISTLPELTNHTELLEVIKNQFTQRMEVIK